ncbi:hypothetical protein SUH3_18120 [Pseudosulfitobacter pseudonitzschiae]|uniref:Uncharacterized protein n=1 Tax=Pseudosulfitobacter pseudonitzschiae TaxID=1402135 RepID=A0A073J2I1_9RHOB|nr:hypothetical protein SUH3_18120 [Pseudosulfitobacter pseudonitzschiae]
MFDRFPPNAAQDGRLLHGSSGTVCAQARQRCAPLPESRIDRARALDLLAGPPYASVDGTAAQVAPLAPLRVSMRATSVKAN